MASLNRQQFWKANPNQMALPGLEGHAHPAAMHVAQGYTFEDTTRQHGAHMQGSHRMDAIHSEGHTAAYIEWGDKGPAWATGHSTGEIGMVQTHPENQHEGLATALYGVGRSMARIKPQHSITRTPRGDSWAKKATALHGGRVPKKNDFNLHG